jgi:hypothetical protein
MSHLKDIRISSGNINRTKQARDPQIDPPTIGHLLLEHRESHYQFSILNKWEDLNIKFPWINTTILSIQM